MVQLRAGMVSITGNFRDNNEDSVVVDHQLRYAIVADGMGGQAAGEKASSLAVELIPKRLEGVLDFQTDDPAATIEAIDRAVEYANTEIMALGQVDPNLNQMGTTVAFFVRIGEQAFVGGVGDSRVYLMANGELTQLSKDHSLTQALCDAGTISPAEAKTHRYKNVLYRYLGTRDGAKGTDARQLPLRAGERFLICSDGVTDGLDSEQLSRLMAADRSPQQIAESVVEAAQAGGSRDNITCVVLFAE